MDARMYHRFCLCMELMSGLSNTPRPHGDRGWTFDEWWKMLLALDPRDARVVVLSVLHGMVREEVAERLEVSRGRVIQLFNRAMRMLRKRMNPDLLVA